MAKKEEMLQRLDGLLSGPARNPRRKVAPASPYVEREISAQERERRSRAGRKPSWDRERLTANRTYTSLSLDSESYSKIDLSKNIFLLTDGEVFDREKCIELISNNSSKFRVHALGIGNSFDEVLIKQCGKLGKGSSSFVKELEKINSVVIDTLNKGLRPYIKI